MDMKNGTTKLGLALLVLTLLLIGLIDAGRVQPIDWRHSYNQRDKIPYGLYIAHRELPRILGDAVRAEDMSKSDGNYPAIRDFLAGKEETALVYIVNYFDASTEATGELLSFAERGGEVFISANNFYNKLLDSLGVGMAHHYPQRFDKVFDFEDRPFALNDGTTAHYEDLEYPGLFHSLDGADVRIIGHFEDEGKQLPNFIEVKYGKGRFLLHLEPLMFTNYYLLREANYRYAAAALKLLRNRNVLWHDAHHRAESARTPLRVLLQHDGTPVPEQAREPGSGGGPAGAEPVEGICQDHRHAVLRGGQPRQPGPQKSGPLPVRTAQAVPAGHPPAARPGVRRTVGAAFRNGTGGLPGIGRAAGRLPKAARVHGPGTAGRQPNDRRFQKQSKHAMSEMEHTNMNNPPESRYEPRFENRIDLTELEEKMNAVKREVKKIIVGQDDVLHKLLISILASGHALIEGMPGVAKTLTAKLLAKSISGDFKRIQFTPDLMPSDVTGASVLDLKTNEFAFKKGPIFGNIVLIDEINRAPAKTQSSLFECMSERQVTADGSTYAVPQPFVVFATQNPIEHEGTYRLPEAQLDRFLFKIDMDYPQLADEVEILKEHHAQKARNKEEQVQAVLRADEIPGFQNLIKLVYVHEDVFGYIASVIFHTRQNPNLTLGASPRASIAILEAAKANAALRGRDFVTPDDVKYVAPSILGHRVILTPEREMEGFTADFVIKQIMDGIEIPR